MKSGGILIMLLAFKVFALTGQEKTGSSAQEGELYLNFRNISFVKNNEYSNPVTEGYTLIGYFIQPELVYKPAEKVTLRLGTHLLSYSGTNRFSFVKPVFSTSWHFSENTIFTLGSLAGSESHRMSDPHFNKERMYNAFSEDGLQFRTSSDNLFSDTWLSWENYIFRGDNEREVFTAGESFRYSSPEYAGLIRIEIPVQILFKHYGGQISNYPEHVETYFNLSSGVKALFEIDEPRNRRIGLECLAFFGSCLTGNAGSGIKNGYADWYKLFYSFRGVELETGFWKSHDFYAPNGNFIFGSVSDHIDNLVLSDRNLITGSINIKLPYKDFFEFHLGFDGYYDIDLNRFDNAITLHLKLDKLIKIATIKE
ncbi:MAG TPA: hypothetical protein DEO60_14560 [Bacteroidales bacterium]|nr:hypothetical protein [Bacteroidales bacterium]HBZ22352.1 hypothetical protein [Bacteroidales bacterium]